MFNSSRMANVKDITGSKFDDYILGNSLPNEIVCDSGHDVIRGAGGTDMYIISEDCKAAIDNFDLGLDLDLLFVEKLFLLQMRVKNDSLNIYYADTPLVPLLRELKW